MGFSKSLGFFREAGLSNPASRKVPAVTHQGVHQNQLKIPLPKIWLNTILMQKLIVRNFGPIKELDLEIKDLMLFIGEIKRLGRTFEHKNKVFEELI
jgi:hypothetical protein